MGLYTLQMIQDRGLTEAESRFALYIKDPRNISACALFDKVISVDKGLGKAGCEITSNGRLASPHGADKYDAPCHV
jgi:hypothetical protein